MLSFVTNGLIHIANRSCKSHCHTFSMDSNQFVSVLVPTVGDSALSDLSFFSSSTAGRSLLV